MIISNSWTLVSVDGALIQKHGTNVLSLAYALVLPTTETVFTLAGNEPQILPTVGTKNIYAKAPKGDVSISVETL